MPITLPILSVAGETSCGCVRTHNEDNFCCAVMPGGYVLAAVADGVGGNAGGEIASYLACHRLLWSWKQFWLANPAPKDSELSQFLFDAVREANADIYRINQERHASAPMASTIAAAVFSPRLFITAHAGDSRIYCVRNNLIRQLTCDHTLRNQLDEAGRLRMKDEPPRNIISRALGPLKVMPPEMHSFFRAPEDKYLVCSDGITAHWQLEEIKEVLDRAATPREAVGKLIAGTLRRGAVDNVTVICVFADAAAIAQNQTQ